MLYRSKSVAVVLLLLTFFGASGAWHATDDRDGELQLVAHDHGSHQERLGSKADPVADTGHCALCHWLRTFGSGSPRDILVATSDAPRPAPSATIVNAARSTALLSLPPRAPPLG